MQMATFIKVNSLKTREVVSARSLLSEEASNYRVNGLSMTCTGRAHSHIRTEFSRTDCGRKAELVGTRI